MGCDGSQAVEERGASGAGGVVEFAAGVDGAAGWGAAKGAVLCALEVGGAGGADGGVDAVAQPCAGDVKSAGGGCDAGGGGWGCGGVSAGCGGYCEVGKSGGAGIDAD